MPSWFGIAVGYGIGVSVGRAIFGEDRRKSHEPIRQQTEEEILADEKRYEEEAKQYEAEGRTGK
ncbi:MAG TPA: hypothetical protein VE093_20130 [Polyangiaceae bacterium]|jgi:hypothetical protein|nr:hypothetical protein [Polyangiaceae bacterium]